MTRRAVPLAFGFLAGLYAAYALCVSGTAGSAGFLFLVVSAALLGALALIFKVRFRARALLFLVALICAVAYSWVYTSLRLRPLEMLSGETVTISGRVTDMTYGDSAAIIVDGDINGISTKLLVYVNDFSGGIGDKVTLTARAETFADTPFFNARRYYLPDGVMLYAQNASDIRVTDGDPTIVERLRAYSRDVSESIRRIVPSGAGQFLSAMVTGDRASMSDALNLGFNRAGVGHLASVSGFHVSVIAFAVYAALRKARFPKILSVLVSEAAIAAFVVFAGLRISALRAAIMMTVALGAEVFRKRTDPLNTICLCALALTLFMPYTVADVSFQLSLAGVLGAVVIAPNLIQEFDLKSGVAKAFAVSLCAQAATTPFIIQYFNEISVVAPITNLAAVPVSCLALILGMLYAALGCRPRFLIRFAGALVSLVVKLCECVSSFRAAYIPLGNRLLPTLGLVALAVCVTFYVVTKKRRMTAFFAAFCAAAVLLAHGVYTVADSQNVHMTVINRAAEHALVLRKGAECIIIDFDSRSADAFETLAERNGITSPRAAILYGRAEAGYSAYSSIAAKPEIIYLPANSYVYGGAVPCGNIPDGTKIALPWCSITADSGGAHIVTENGEADIRLGAADGGGIKISLLDGVTVINDGEITAYSGDLIKNIRLGGT